MPKHIIQAINFGMSHSEWPLISNLNWVVDESEWIEIVGNNNSGKTSLLNAIYGHMSQCSGQLIVLDFSMLPVSKFDLAGLRRKLGYASQDSKLLKNKTLRANLAMALNASDRLGSQSYDGTITDLVEKFSLKDMLLREVKDLSYSQQHLASLSRALIHRPKLLLIDQSFDILDSETRIKVIDIIQNYRLSERMTILSTSVYSWSKEISNCKTFQLMNQSLLAVV